MTRQGTWRKSSYSGTNSEGDCVEVAFAEEVGVRDSKNADGPELRFEPRSWTTFLRWRG